MSAPSTSSGCPGERVELTVLRGRASDELTVDLGERPANPPSSPADLLRLARRGSAARGSGPARGQPRAPAALRRRVFQLVYADPPFNTGRRQRRLTLATDGAPDGDRTGFGGRRYATRVARRVLVRDRYDDYLGFLEPRLREVRRLLRPTGTLYLHLDYREAHYAKVLLDELFGRECFLNEIVWAYDYGARPRRRWPAKHDTILVYVKDPERYWFDAEEVEREPYMAPGLVTAEKAARGKLPTDVWWHTIVSPTGKEKTGYPTQKPEGIVGGWSRRRRGPATGASIRSPGAGRSAPSARSSAAATC